MRRRAGTAPAPSVGRPRRRRRRRRASPAGELAPRTSATSSSPRVGHAERRRRRRGSCTPARRCRPGARRSTTSTPADASCVEHLGRAGAVVGEHDGRLERQDRLGVERALVADLRRVVGRRRVRRRDVGGDDLVAEAEGVDDLGEVAVDRDDPARRRRPAGTRRRSTQRRVGVGGGGRRPADAAARPATPCPASRGGQRVGAAHDARACRTSATTSRRTSSASDATGRRSRGGRRPDAGARCAAT